MCRTSICRLKTTLFPPSQMENFQCSLTWPATSGGKSVSCLYHGSLVYSTKELACSAVVCHHHNPIRHQHWLWVWPLTNCQTPAGLTLLQSQDSPNFPHHPVTSFQSRWRLALYILCLNILDFNTWYRGWNLIEYLGWCLYLWTELQ